MYNQKKAEKKSGKRHQVLFGQGMPQDVLQLENLALFLQRVGIQIMHWAVQKGNAGFRVMIVVAHTGLGEAGSDQRFIAAYSAIYRQENSGNEGKLLSSALLSPE